MHTSRAGGPREARHGTTPIGNPGGRGPGDRREQRPAPLGPPTMSKPIRSWIGARGCEPSTIRFFMYSSPVNEVRNSIPRMADVAHTARAGATRAPGRGGRLCFKREDVHELGRVQVARGAADAGGSSAPRGVEGRGHGLDGQPRRGQGPGLPSAPASARSCRARGGQRARPELGSARAARRRAAPRWGFDLDAVEGSRRGSTLRRTTCRSSRTACWKPAQFDGYAMIGERDPRTARPAHPRA